MIHQPAPAAVLINPSSIQMPSASAAAAALVLLFLAFSLSNAQPGQSLSSFSWNSLITTLLYHSLHPLQLQGREIKSISKYKSLKENPIFDLLHAGFISLDCGGDDDYTDGIGIQWTSDAKFVSAGQEANLLLQNQQLQQYTTVRSFPADNRKYCYTMNVRNRTRYLVRATFLYGNFDNSNVYPKFDLSLGPTPWTTVVIDDATTPVVQEAIILAAAPTLSVCLSNASTGQPFISTLELRQFNGSLYYTTDEKQFFLRLSARINFGAESNASVRYALLLLHSTTVHTFVTISG